MVWILPLALLQNDSAEAVRGTGLALLWVHLGHQGCAAAGVLKLLFISWLIPRLGKTHLWCPLLTSVAAPQLPLHLETAQRVALGLQLEGKLYLALHKGKKVTGSGTGAQGCVTMGDAELVWSWGLKGCEGAVGMIRVGRKGGVFLRKGPKRQQEGSQEGLSSKGGDSA